MALRNEGSWRSALRAYPWSFMGFLLLCAIVPKLYDMLSIYWLGRISSQALGIAEQQEFLAIAIEVINEAAAVGVLALVAQHAARRDEALEALGSGLTFCLTSAALLALLIWLVPQWFIKAVGTPPQLVADTASYLRLRACGLPFDAAGLVLLTALKALRRGRSALLIVVFATLLNAALDLGLISTVRFSLRMGVAGLALGYVLTKMGLCLVSAITLQRLLAIRSSDLFGKLRLAFPRFLASGGWAGAESLVRNLGYMVLLTVLNTLGPDAFAGYGLAMTLMWTALLPALALAEGSNIVVGYLYGARQHAQLDRTLGLSLALVLVMMAGWLLLGALYFRSAAQLLTPHPAIAAAAVRVFAVLAVPYVFLALSQILKSVFIGTGQTVSLFLVSLLINALLIIPYALRVRAFGSPPSFGETMGLVAATVLTDFLLTLFLAWRLRRRIWNRASPASSDSTAALAAQPNLFPHPAME